MELATVITAIIGLLSLVVSLPVTYQTIKRYKAETEKTKQETITLKADADKSIIEAKALLSQAAENYSSAAASAVASQASLQKQIDELRESLKKKELEIIQLQMRLVQRDKDIAELREALQIKNFEIAQLQRQLSSRDTKILNLESQISSLEHGQAMKDSEIANLRSIVDGMQNH
jgi:chromosome segregation ATPase